MEAIGNTNRPKRLSPVGIRATTAEYDAWQRAADSQGLKRNRWARNTLNEEAALAIAKADDERRLQAQQEREKIVAETFPDKKFKPDFK